MYDEFLKNKVRHSTESGFDCNNFNTNLFDFQQYCVKWALKKGKSALFSDTGTGKTIMQLEWCNKVVLHTKKPVLILAPLAVSGQTIQEGKKFNIEIQKFNYNASFWDAAIYISNYEQLKNIDCSIFSGICLDESSILKNYTGVYKRQIIDLFRYTPYKLACTATPSPNDYLELGNHSDFLDVMPSNEMISRFFINDTMKMGGYRLKRHGEEEFFDWVSSWAIMFNNPNDIGFNHPEFVLPKLNIQEIQVEVDINDTKNGNLFKHSNVNATSFNKELRNTLKERMTKTSEIVNNSKENFIIWINQNDEADYLKKIIPDAIEVRGNEKSEIKEKKLLGFAKNEFRVLITKKKIAQFGLNYQNCHNQIFASLDFSFEGLYQAIRRSYRYKQEHEVNVKIITTSTMNNVIEIINSKQLEFKKMQVKMIKSVKKIMNKNVDNLGLKMKFNYNKKENNHYTIYQGDSVEVIEEINKNSIDFSIFSPPFSNLYIYSDSIRDMGNCKDDEEFFEQFRYLIPKLHRIMRPGRLIAVHCKQLVNYMNSSGKSGLRDFRGDIIRSFIENDFSYHAEVTIWKCPVTEMYRTKAHGLLYKQLRSDSSFNRVGLAEYLLLFRKWPDETNKHLVKEVDWKTKENFPLERWQEWASPVWNTIQQTNVLNIKEAKENKDEKHICPLQLDIIDRAVQMWSNPNEIVFSPFMGIGSEGYQAILNGRKFKGIELKEVYFNKAVNNLNLAIAKTKQSTLF